MTDGQTDGRTDGQQIGESWGPALGSAFVRLSVCPSVRPVLRALTFICAAMCFPPRIAAQQSHLVIISGIPGGTEYAERFRGWATQMIDGALKTGVPQANITYLSDEPPKDAAYSVGVSNKEQVEKTFADLATKAAPDDVILILLIGHGSAQGGEARFNLPGPDLTARDYARLLDKFRSQRIALVNAASASGDFVAPLSRKSRTIVTATRSGGEKNETVFAGYFVQAYSADGADADKDGRVSILEAFDYARREVARFYEGEHRIQTEHALLDDNGDGTGSREPSPSLGDGALARRFVLIGGTAGRRDGDPADSVLAPLYADARRLEEEIATLRAKKDSMKTDAYEVQLEDLLVKLAEKNQTIREREKKP